jgi:tRNA G18 (ribose-2'-O)-methylase SpoU
MKKEIYVLLHNIRSLYNVGSIFRTADAAGVSKIFICGYTGTPPRKEITKTAIGAEEYVEWEHYPDPVSLIYELKQKNIQIISLEKTPKSIDFKTFKPKYPLCLTLGHELEGVRADILDLSDAVISIPMLGQKESLNVSVAFGISIYSLI